MRLSVVIPVFNEQDNVKELFEEIKAALAGIESFEVIFVDDGSSDGTVERLQSVAETSPELRILCHEGNFGQSAAVRSGVMAAQAPWIATLDGDGQNDPIDIPNLFTIAESASENECLDMVAGWRKSRKDTWVKRLSSRLANGVRSRVLRDATPDTGCGLKVFRRDAYLELPFFDHNHRFLPALIQRRGGKVQSVEVNHRPRLRGESSYGVWNRVWVGIVDMLGVNWLQRRAKRPVVTEVR